MNFKNYVFILLTGLIYTATSMTDASFVCASQAVFDEIEKVTAPAEEIHIDKPVKSDLSEHHPAEIEEQPAAKEEEPEENTFVQPVKKENISVKKQNTEPKREDIKVKAKEPDKNTSVQPVKEEKVANENPEEKEPVKTPEKNYFSPSKYFNKYKTAFSNLLFDKFNTLKEKITDKFFPNRYEGTVCCKRIPEYKKITGEKYILPYYFLYPESMKNHLERTTFGGNLTHPDDLLPYRYTIRNYEKRTDAPKNAVTAQGTKDYGVLMNAPSPEIEITGKSTYVKLVIDIRNNTLYKYDKDGFPMKAYLVATGARGSRTRPGLRVVTYKDSFPYRGAPNSKRAVDPYSYGPFILFLNAVNPQTGKQYAVDQLLHGNGNENSIGKKVSHGCVRTNNNVMRNEISKEVNRGDYILLINPDIK